MTEHAQRLLARREAVSRSAPRRVDGRRQGPRPVERSTRDPFSVADDVIASLEHGHRTAPSSSTRIRRAPDRVPSVRTPAGTIQRGKGTKTGLTKKLREVQDEDEWDQATGHSGSGRWLPEVNVRGGRSFSADRTQQVLRHISTAVFHFVKKRVEAEQEIQAMFVNDRIFLSANDPTTIDELKKLSAVEIQTMLTQSNAEKSDVRGNRSAKKVKDLVEGRRDDQTYPDEQQKAEVEEIKRILQRVMGDPKGNLHACGVSEAHNLIEPGELAHQVILVRGLEGAHAEQNLILAYARSGSNAVAHVYGKKRPCTGCLMTFVFASETMGKTGLRYNNRPGGFWGPSVEGLWENMRTLKPNIQLEEIDSFVRTNLPKQQYRSARSGTKGDSRKSRGNTSSEDTGYDTESDAED